MYLLHTSVVDNHAEKAESRVLGPSMSYSLHTIHSMFAVRNSVECEPQRGLPVLSVVAEESRTLKTLPQFVPSIIKAVSLNPLLNVSHNTSYLSKPCVMLQPGRLSTNKEDATFGKLSPSYGGRHTAGGMSYHFRMHGKMTMVPLSRLIPRDASVSIAKYWHAATPCTLKGTSSMCWSLGINPPLLL
jgi:hypothetical protein